MNGVCAFCGEVARLDDGATFGDQVVIETSVDAGMTWFYCPLVDES